jgi:hypothetical protein
MYLVFTSVSDKHLFFQFKMHMFVIDTRCGIHIETL